MSKPGDVVEFTSGLHGLDAPRNVALLLDRRRVKGVPWVKVLTLDGEKEIKAEHLSRRVFRARYDGRLDDKTAALARLRHLAQQHAGGALEEEAEDDLARLEGALWEATCDAGRDAWTEEELAQALYRGAPSPMQLRNVREALDACRRPGTGRFQTVGGRGDRWRPWSRAEHDAMLKSWEDLQALRRKLVATEETDDGRVFHRIDLNDAALGDAERATLGWVKAAMVQYVDWDGIPANEAVAGIGGLGAVRAFGMDLHRNLGFLAQDWIGSEHTSTSSDYIHFLLEAGLWSPQDAVDGLIRRHVNQEEFFEHVPDAAAQEAALRFPDPSPEPGRTDLRHIPCWTIDPPDAKDFDDAVGLEDLGAGRTRLWVHVADVSHYVTPDSTLDRHAKKRATSVYLPGRVLPMLPPRLSDHLCSLRDDGDRYALSVSLDVEPDGRSTARAFHKAIIRVTENLSYAKALERAQAGVAPFPALLDLARRMQQHRRGIALETGELKVLLGATGFSALEKRADDATKMIETFMVAANEAVASHLDERQVAQLFRCHPLPDRNKAERLGNQLRTMGFDVELDLPGRAASPGGSAATQSLLDRLKAGGGKLNLFGGGISLDTADPEPQAPDDEPQAPQGFAALSPQDQEAWLAPFRQAVDAIAQHPDGNLAEVATLKVLSTMSRAFYAPDNQGHFGLALTHYSHFTSPIRRYPDLVVHRNLKWLLDGSKGPMPHTAEGLRTLCDHCSNQERAADGLERRIKSSCLVLASLQGATEGRARVTGITPASLFVLRSDGIEARIAQRDLPGGPFQVDEWESMLFTGEQDDPSRFAGASTKDLLDWLDPESGEVRRVRARLGQPVAVALAGRDVADGRTGARLLAWR
ncbi:MAG: ribonuclease R family protein [Candidatus Thermoplasmatota archaeon]